MRALTLPDEDSDQPERTPYGPSPLDGKSLTKDAQQALEDGYPDEAAYILLLAAWRPAEVARVCGYPDHQAMRKAVTKLRRQQTIESREARQWHEIQRLERLERALQPQIAMGNVEAINQARLLSAERRQIMGDDEPKRVALPQLPPDAEMERIAKLFKAGGGLSMDLPALLADFKEVAQKGGFLPAGSDGETAGDVLDAEMAEVVVDAEHEGAESDG